MYNTLFDYELYTLYIFDLIPPIKFNFLGWTLSNIILKLGYALPMFPLLPGIYVEFQVSFVSHIACLRDLYALLI